MALEEYRRKRDFTKTPEPAPATPKAHGKQLSYLIQKHDATRLHYDFRLELDGVLLSWAVTKGPSLNPSDKRLAVRTEDHPLSYGSFEGTIPKGQYGGGTVMLWDKGTWEPEGDPHAGLKKGHLAFELHGERLKGHWDLVRMRTDEKRENWLLIKKKDAASNGHAKTGILERSTDSVQTGRSMDEIAHGAAPLKARKTHDSAGIERLVTRYPEVQLATLVDAAPEGQQWVHEIKFDGYRLLGFLSDGDVRLRTRNGKNWTEKFPAIATALSGLQAGDAVIDMEAVVLDREGKSSFQNLQAALGSGGHTDEIVAFAFDLLHLDGASLTTLPLLDRKAKLKALLKMTKAKAIHYSDHVEGDGATMYAQACKKGLEGILSKLSDSPYSPGRGKSWLKVKCALRQEFVIVGYSIAKKGERALGALYLGYQKDGGLRYAGKVGTGFTMKSAAGLADQLNRIAAKKPVFTRSATKGVSAGEWAAIKWAEPKMLCEVSFTEWTADGRIRHPSFQGLREDKEASDVRKENPTHMRTATVTNQTGKLTAAGITITHPERVISETGHITKGELAAYFEAVAPFMLPSIINRPISLLRCPDGIDGGECFYQRNPGRGLGKDVHPYEFHHKGKTYQYLYLENEKGLLEVIQMGAIEIHPWGAKIDSIDYPDRMIFDLDPAPEVEFDAVKAAALELRKLLKKKGLESTLKCTGGKGLHVTVALAGKNKWDEVKSFAGSVAHEMVETSPDAYIATMTKAKRTGKIFIDFFRNDYTATAIADYGVRARPGAPVAVPLDWKELPKLTSASQFTIRDVLQRLKNHKPPAQPKGHTLPL